MKKAFTMLELVFVIVIAGILAAVIIPKTRTNPTAEVAVELQAKIRYAQHLAIIDDKFNSNATWYKDRWQIVFDDNKYSIMSDNNATYARDTTDSSKEIKDIDLNEQGASLTFSGGCSEDNVTNKMYLSFDNMGRPLLGNLNNYTLPYMSAGNEKILQTDCDITISAGTENLVISIEPITGNIKGI